MKTVNNTTATNTTTMVQARRISLSIIAKLGQHVTGTNTIWELVPELLIETPNCCFGDFDNRGVHVSAFHDSQGNLTIQRASYRGATGNYELVTELNRKMDGGLVGLRQVCKLDGHVVSVTKAYVEGDKFVVLCKQVSGDDRYMRKYVNGKLTKFETRDSFSDFDN